jgi:hypothetical protein
MRMFFLLAAFVMAATTAQALVGDGGSPGGGVGFSCDVYTSRCSCDGTYLDCKGMKDTVCKKGEMSCAKLNGKENCQCDMKNEAKSPTLQKAPPLQKSPN